MDGFPYRSLTHLLEDIGKNKPSQFDEILKIVGSKRDFNNNNEITLDEIYYMHRELTDETNLVLTGSSSSYEIGREFYDRMLNTYTRIKGCSDTLSNRKAKSLRRKERDVLENLIRKGGEI